MQTKRVRFENEESQVQDMMHRAVDAMKSGDNTPPKSTSSPAQAVAKKTAQYACVASQPRRRQPTPVVLLHQARVEQAASTTRVGARVGLPRDCRARG